MVMGLSLEYLQDWYSFFIILYRASRAGKQFVANSTKVGLITKFQGLIAD
jgi:hypothetical protein